MTASQWNARYPVGTPVRYRPSVKLPDLYRDSVTTRPAWTSQSGHAVISLAIRSGSFSIDFLEVLAGLPAESEVRT